jgi:hypothetical protein
MGESDLRSTNTSLFRSRSRLFPFHPLSLCLYPLDVTIMSFPTGPRPRCTNTTAFSVFALSSALPSPPRNKLSSIRSEGHHFDVLRIIKTCKFRQERDRQHVSSSSGAKIQTQITNTNTSSPHGPRPRSRVPRG